MKTNETAAPKAPTDYVVILHTKAGDVRSAFTRSEFGSMANTIGAYVRDGKRFSVVCE